MDGFPVSIERQKRRCPARHQKRYRLYLSCQYPLPTHLSYRPYPNYLSSSEPKIGRLALTPSLQISRPILLSRMHVKPPLTSLNLGKNKSLSHVGQKVGSLRPRTIEARLLHMNGGVNSFGLARITWYIDHMVIDPDMSMINELFVWFPIEKEDYPNAFQVKGKSILIVREILKECTR